ncbi:type II toxin-antitoxin system prevent-host-death family antitoxin [Pseudokineococcus basanitobsidens]|uniref:Type II toxin-antitoxin system prevent-host-death family antitoxin n=1 Tax=Pseudokineococcus basanitobsidens TaxID=1926649 RepID=A0ABU8RIV8_9ACTN
MDHVTVRQLRNDGGAVLDRVARGASLVVTRDGAEVAELRPRRRPGPSAEDLVARRRHLPAVDPSRLRDDLDTVLDPRL